MQDVLCRDSQEGSELSRNALRGRTSTPGLELAVLKEWKRKLTELVAMWVEIPTVLQPR